VIIAVTGLNTAGEPEAGFGVLQCLSAVKASHDQLIGLAYQPLDAGLFHAGLMHRAYVMPPPKTDRMAFLKRITLIKKQKGLDALIPAVDEEMELFIDMEPQLRAAGIATLLPFGKSLRELQSELYRQLGKQKDADEKDEQNDPPVLPPALIKNPVSEQTAPNAAIAPDYFSVAVVADCRSRIVAIASVRKLLISRYGGTWMALTVDNHEFLDIAEEMVRSTAWQGALTIDIARNRQGEQFLSGFHSTFPDWIGLARGAGANLPAVLIHLIQKKKIRGVAETLPGKVWIRSSIDLVTDLNHFGDISLNGEMTYDQK